MTTHVTHVVGIDVGGTETKAALAEVDGERAVPLRRLRRRTPHGETGDRTATAVVESAAALIGELGDVPVSAAGVVVPGTVDERHGIARYSGNLGWRDAPLLARLREHTALPVALGHDVRAGGLAEARMGAGRGVRDAVFLAVGTGIAAALMLDGSLYSAGGHAGEVGHIDVGHDEKCRCGQTGCLEAIASAAAIARRYTARGGDPAAGALDVAALVRASDPLARAVWAEAVEALATAITTLCAIVAPERVILGGGLAGAERLLTDPLREHIDARMTFHRRPELALGALGDMAGCLGAALLAADEVRQP